MRSWRSKVVRRLGEWAWGRGHSVWGCNLQTRTPKVYAVCVAPGGRAGTRGYVIGSLATLVATNGSRLVASLLSR